MNARLTLLLALTWAVSLPAPVAAGSESDTSRGIGVYELGMRPASVSPPEKRRASSSFTEKVDEVIKTAATTDLHNADDLANAFKYLDNVTESGKSVDKVLNSGKSIDKVLPGTKPIGKFIDSGKSIDKLVDGGKSIDKVLDGGKSVTKMPPSGKSWGARLGRACDVFTFGLASAKVLRAHQLDKHSQIKQTSYTAVTEYTKWGVGTVVGGLVVTAIMGISVSNPLTAMMVATYAAWGTTTVVENTIDRVAVTYFHPLHETKDTGPLDPRMVQWLGARAKNGLTLDIQTKHLEVPPTFIPENMMPTQAVTIIRTAQDNCIRRAGDLLDLASTPFGPIKRDKPPTIDELAGRIPPGIISEEQLADFVSKRAQKVVNEDAELGASWTGEPTAELQYKAYMDRAYPYIYRAWQERRAGLERQLQRLKRDFEMTALDLTISPEDPEIDPTTGKAVIHFTLEGQAIGEALTKARRIERSLTGKEPTATCSVRWKSKPEHGDGGLDQSAEWPRGGKWWAAVTKPGWVTFSYAVTVSLNYPPGSRWEMVSSDNIPIEVTGEELLLRTFAATRMSDDLVGTLRMTIKGTAVEGVTDTRLEPPDRSGEMKDPDDVGDIVDNIGSILNEAFRGLRHVIQYRGTFDPATSTVRGTATLRSGMKDGPLDEPKPGTFRGTLRGNVLSVTYTINDPKNKEPWTKTFQLREQRPDQKATPADR